MAETVIVTLLATVPPDPVQVNVYVVVVFGETLCAPLVALVPVQPPEAEQELALVDDHESAADCPEVIEDDEAENVNVGAGGVGAVTVTLCIELSV